MGRGGGERSRAHHAAEGGWVRNKFPHEREVFSIPELQWAVLVLGYQIVPAKKSAHPSLTVVGRQ